MVLLTIDIRSVNLKVRFKCSLSVFFLFQNKEHCLARNLPLHQDKIVEFNTFELDIPKSLFESIVQKNNGGPTLLQVVLTSPSGKMLIASKSVDLTSIDGEKYFEENLQKCPDKNARIQYTISIDKDKDTMSIGSRQEIESIQIKPRKKVQQRVISRNLEKPQSSGIKARSPNIPRSQVHKISPQPYSAARKLVRSRRSSSKQQRNQYTYMNVDGYLSPKHRVNSHKKLDSEDMESQKTNKMRSSSPFIKINDYHIKQISDLKIQIGNLKNQIIFKQNKLKQIEQSRTRLLEKYTKLQKQLKNQILSHQSISSKIKHLKNELSEKQQKIESQQLTIQSLIKRQETKTSAFKQQLKSQSDKIIVLESDRQELRFNLQKHDTQTENFQKKYRQQLETVHFRYRKNIQELKNKITFLESEKTDISMENKSLIGQKQEANIRLENFLSGMTVSSNEKQTLKDIISQLNLNLQKKNQQINFFENTVDSNKDLKQQLESCKAQRNQTLVQKDKLIVKCESLQQKQQSLQSDITFKNEQIQRSSQKIKNLNKEITILMEGQSTLTKKTEDKDLKVSELNHKLNQQNQKYQVLKREKYQNQINLNHKITQLQKKIEKQKRESSQLKNSKEKLQSELKFQLQALDETNGLLDEREKLIKAVNQNLESFKVQLKALDGFQALDKLSQLKNQSKNVNMDESTSKKLEKFDLQTAAHRLKIQTLYLIKHSIAEYKILQQKNQSLMTEISNIKSTFDQLEAETIQEKGRSQVLSNKKSDLQQKMVSTESMLTQMKTMLKFKNEEISKATKKLAILQEEKSFMEKQIRHKNHQLNDLEYENNGLKKNIQDLEDQICVVFDRLQQSRQSLSHLKNSKMVSLATDKNDDSVSNQQSPLKSGRVKGMLKHIDNLDINFQNLNSLTQNLLQEKASNEQSIILKDQTIAQLSVIKECLEEQKTSNLQQITILTQQLKQEKHSRTQADKQNITKKNIISSLQKQMQRLQQEKRSLFNQASKKWKIVIPWLLKMVASNKQNSIFKMTEQNQLKQPQIRVSNKQPQIRVSEQVLFGQYKKSSEQNCKTVATAFADIERTLKDVTLMFKNAVNNNNILNEEVAQLKRNKVIISRDLKQLQMASKQRSDQVISLTEKMTEAKRNQQKLTSQREKWMKKMQNVHKALDASEKHSAKLKIQLNDLQEKTKMSTKVSKITENDLISKLKTTQALLQELKISSSKQLKMKQIEIEEQRGNNIKGVKVNEQFKKQNTDLLQSNGYYKSHIHKVSVLLGDVYKCINNIERQNKVSSFYLIPMRDSVKKIEAALSMRGTRINSKQKKNIFAENQEPSDLKSIDRPSSNAKKQLRKLRPTKTTEQHQFKK